MSTFEPRPDPESEDSDPRDLVGSTIGGRYKVKSLLGEGGMGAVYLVEHLQIRKNMALKVLSRKMMSVANVVARFEREATATAHFDHPNVVAASDYGRMEDGRYYLVLEYVDGKELRDVVREIGALPPVRAFYIARQIASALARAHALGIVHRDLKPDNIMLERRDGNADFVRVLDFGLSLVSRHLHTAGGDEHSVKTVPKLTRTGEIFGTPPYMSPEQAVGATMDIRTDFYSLGVILYEMLTGVRPFEGSILALIQHHIATPPPPMKVRAPKAPVTEEMEALVQRLLAKQPADRFQTPAELIAAIDRVGAAHNLAWPGSSPSLTPVSRSGQSQSAPIWRSVGQPLSRAGSGLVQAWQWAKDKVLPEPKPKGTLSQALLSLRNKVGWRTRKARPRFPPWLMILGAGLMVTLLGSVFWLRSRESLPASEPGVRPQKTAAPAKTEEPREKVKKNVRSKAGGTP